MIRNKIFWLTVHCHHSELVSVAWLQALHHDRVLVKLVLSLEPRGLLQFPEKRVVIRYVHCVPFSDDLFISF